MLRWNSRPIPQEPCRDRYARAVCWRAELHRRGSGGCGDAVSAAPGRWPGAIETWLTILALWLLGWTLAATRSRPADSGELSGRIGVQNLAIQALIAVPGILVGTTRMLTQLEGAPPASYPANALTTLIVLPLASLVVLTFAALPLAIAVRALTQRLRGQVPA